MPKIVKTCECGRTFTTYPSINSKHCSRACSARFIPRKPRTGTVVNCEVCGVAFYQSPTAARMGIGRFCSNACNNASQTKPPVIKACAYCGAEMRLKPSQEARRYCCKEHEALARTMRPLERVHNGRPARMDRRGYVLLWEPEHPNRSYKNWQPEHRLVIEHIIGRYLTSDEQVDHINGIKDDNRPENLQVLSASEHSAKTVRDMQNSLAAERAELAEYRRRYGSLTSGGINANH